MFQPLKQRRLLIGCTHKTGAKTFHNAYQSAVFYLTKTESPTVSTINREDHFFYIDLETAMDSNPRDLLSFSHLVISQHVAIGRVLVAYKHWIWQFLAYNVS